MVGFKVPVSTDGLIYYLDAGYNASYPGSGSSWYDLSGYNRHATLYNSPGFSASSITFNGSSSYAESSLVTNATGNVTMIAWFQTFDRFNDGQMIFYNGSDASANGYGFAINRETITDGTYFLLRGGIAWGGTNVSATAGWHHAALVVDATRSMTFYVDGTPIVSSWAGSINTPTSKTDIGRNDYPSQRYLTGSVAIAQMYSRALSSAEVAANFNMLRWRFGV
jgi:hypothetical protein